jgi:hypothetical protein
MPKPSRSDSDERLLTRALREGWHVPEEKKTKVIEMLCAIVAAPDAKKRERTSAARALLQASRVELDAIRLAQGIVGDDLTRRVEDLEGGAGGELATAAGAD